MSITNTIGDALGSTLFGSDGDAFAPNRIPMTFTSLFRLQNLGYTPISVTKKPELNFTQDVKKLIVEGVDGTTAPGGVLDVIQLAINPNSISFRQPKRITKRDTQAGSIYFHFSNKKDENNDILVIDFAGNTGNLNTRGDRLNQDDDKDKTNNISNFNGARQKLLLFHNLWQLTREPMAYFFEGVKIVNEFIIRYETIAIPTPIYLIGFFESVLAFTENADKPFSKDYSFSFVVQSITPPLDDIIGSIQSYSFDPTVTGGQTG